MNTLTTEALNARAIAGAVAVAGLLAAAFLRYRRALKYPRPPGPPGYPVIGNAFDLPPTQRWLKWAEWRDMYGPIVCLEMFGRRVVMLNDPQLVMQLLEKRSSVSADRPQLVLCMGLLGFGHSTVGLQHNATHKEARRLFNLTIGKSQLHKYTDLVQHEMQKLALKLLEGKGAKDNVTSSIRHAVGGIILAVTYALPVKDQNDPFIEDAEATMGIFARTSSPGTHTVDVFPFLQYAPSWFPGAGFKKYLALWKQQIRNSLERPVAVVKRELANGEVKTSVAHEIFAEANMSAQREEELKWLTGSMYLGGSDTTASAIHIFVLALTCYPDIQTRAQQELDSVIGDRIATLEDRPNLPYVNAIVKEVLRWHTVTPLGGPHRLTSDAEIGGYLLPKGTVVLGNVWGILHDEKYFSEPHEFKPERFLNAEDAAKFDQVKRPTASVDSWNHAFGYGRRVCPGRDLADMELWLAIATILSTLKISPTEGGLKPTFTSGSISHPVPFDCVIRPRNARMESLLRELS